MEKWLDLGTALFAFAAAAFWFFSAFENLPPMLSYWGGTPQTDPFYVAMQISVRMNMWAAVLSGLSASCMGGKHFILYWARNR